MNVTLRDVAQLAGVDISTVSRTLGKHPRSQSLRSETRARIFEAAQKLGYRCNTLAKAMQKGESSTVAVITPVIENLPYGSSALRVLYGILASASERNYALKLYFEEEIASAINDIRSSQIKLVICLSATSSKREEVAIYCRQHGLKLVYVYETSHAEFPAIAADNFTVSKEVVCYMVAMGHRRIALVCGEYPAWHYMTEKYKGYIAGLQESGIEPEFQLMICQEDIREPVEKLLSRPQATRPTAFFCIGDGYAMQVQRVALQKGLCLPEDVSTSGFGNTFAAEEASAKLCSVDERQELLGASAFRYVVGEELNFFRESDGTFRIPSKFVLRDSIACLKQSSKG